MRNRLYKIVDPEKNLSELQKEYDLVVEESIDLHYKIKDDSIVNYDNGWVVSGSDQQIFHFCLLEGLKQYAKLLDRLITQKKFGYE